MKSTPPHQSAAPYPVRYALDNALASARLEGLVPTEALLKDCDALVAGSLSSEALIERAKARALLLDQQLLAGKTHGDR